MSDNNDIILIDRAFSPTLFKHMKQWIFSEEFSWSFMESTGISEITDNFSFGRYLYKDGNRIFPESYIVEAGFATMLDNCRLNITQLHRIRVGLITKSAERITNTAHVDHNEPHLTALIYLNTTDAPTYLYDTFYDFKSNMSADEFSKTKKLSIVKMIPCIENTAVIFDGARYHSSNSPTDVSRRVVLNFNFNI